MKSILITGNSGYIGSHLTKLLIERGGYLIYGLDLKEPAIPIYKFVNADITDSIELFDIKFDCVIHLAALVSVSDSTLNPIGYYNTNTTGTVNVLRDIKTKHFIYASTGAAEDLKSPYGISKRMAEDITTQFCTDNNIPFTIFRFYNVIGCECVKPTNPDGLFYALLMAPERGEFTIFGDDYNTIDGTCVRDYTHVNEICHSIIAAINNPAKKIENLGHGIGTSVRQIVKSFKVVNSVDFDVHVGPRRNGDIECSVLLNPSEYMKKLYTMEELLRIPRES
jgi:UDP-glucose 4-epimerase